MKSLMLLTVAAVAATPLAAQSARPSTPAARQAMAAFGVCVAKASPAKSHSALTRDFRTSGYRLELRTLADINRDCHKRGTMRGNGLPFAASLAEAMIHQDSSPLRARLARAATGKAAPTFAPSDAVAMCVARSAPNETADLLSAPVASAAESDAAAKLSVAFKLCTQQVKSPPVAADAYGLRTILATATYRLLAAQQGG